MGKLSGKIAIVTGASSGVGAGIAKVLAAHGASVVLCARRQEKLDEIRREIENRDNEGEVMTVACDVVDDAQIHRAIEATIARFHTIHILVNCAQGAMLYRAIPDIDSDYALLAYKTGPLASLKFMQLCYPYMKKTTGAGSSTPPRLPVLTATRVSVLTAWQRKPSVRSPAQPPGNGGSMGLPPTSSCRSFRPRRSAPPNRRP